MAATDRSAVLSSRWLRWRLYNIFNFRYETMRLMQQGEMMLAMANVFGSLLRRRSARLADSR